MVRWPTRTAVALFAALVAGLANAAVVGPGRDRWEEVTFNGIPATEFMVQADGTVHVIANRSSGLIHRELTDDERGKPVMRWEWQVSDPLPATDLTVKGEDDRAIAVHVWFAEKSSRQGLWARFKRSFAKMAGKPTPGKVISYTWGGNAPPGTILPNPFLKKDGVIIILRSADAETGRWLGEEVDVMADFERAFGYRPAPPARIAISGDSDDSAMRSRAAVRRIRFLPQDDKDTESR
ncbi:MAG: DUF3047 domain-containing protein [Alphaproteobacteria bacterium]|nr:MAG: DUF3047 domain-containing protein [Alphaproteobacteria bacterium]